MTTLLSSPKISSLIAIVFALFFVVAGCKKKSEMVVETKPSAAKTEESKPVIVEMKTSLGILEIEVDSAKAPITAANFIDYVKSGFYDGTIFHRIIPGFVVQGGGFTSDMQQKSVKAPIKNEANNGLQNLSMSLSMARTSDPASATSQFFINLKDNANLNPGGVTPDGYAVFAKVIKGEDVVRKMAEVKTTMKGMYADVPVEPVVIEKATIKN